MKNKIYQVDVGKLINEDFIDKLIKKSADKLTMKT